MKGNSFIDLVQHNGGGARLEIVSAVVVFTVQLRGGTTSSKPQRGLWARVLGEMAKHRGTAFLRFDWVFRI